MKALGASVVPSKVEHAVTLAPLLREADLREISLVSGEDPEAVLKRGLQGDTCLTLLAADGEPFAMFGVAPTACDWIGSVWFLGSDRIREYQKPFLRRCHSFVEAFHSIYPVLTNYVHQDNTLHIRWLKWLDFDFMASPVIINGELFYSFVRTSNNV